MSYHNLFISYSWNDKYLVNCLCANLLAENYNVWIDNLLMKPGEIVSEKIYSGIESCDFFLAIVSKDSVKSGWCMNEIAAALTREKTEQRVLIIPILIDDADIPPQLADRVHIDMRQSMYAALSDILQMLSQYGVKNRYSNVVPLLFDKGSELDEEIFRKCMVSVLNTNKPVFWDIRDTLYTNLRNALSKKAEESSYHLKVFRDVLSLEAALERGLNILFTNATKIEKDITQVCYWFCRIVRFSILASLKNYTMLIDKPSYGYDLNPFESVYSHSQFWNSIYGCEDLTDIDIWDIDGSYTFQVHYPTNSSTSNDLRNYQGFPHRLHSFWGNEFSQKYVWPQRLFSSTYHNSLEPIPWIPGNLRIGLA